MKIYKFVAMLGMLVFLVSRSPTVHENIGDSDKYSKKEIQESMSIVKENLKDSLKGSKLLTLTYDEKESNELTDNYLPTLDVYSKAKKYDTLILNSEIKTGQSSGSLDPQTTYKNYYWVLIKKERWEVIYAGFLN